MGILRGSDRGWYDKMYIWYAQKMLCCIILLYKWCGSDWMSVIKVSEDGQSSYNQQGGYGLLIYSYDTHDNICIENS